MPSESFRSSRTDVDATQASSFEVAPNTCNWIIDLCAPHLAGPVLEVGGGCGSMTERFAAYGAVTAVIAVTAADVVAVDDPRVGPEVGAIGDLAREPTFRSAVMINVLECIEDDQRVLREIYDRLEPGGRLCIWAPTYELLRSRFDDELGRVRRYRKRELEADLRLAGFEVFEGRHVNLLGAFGWLILCRCLRWRPTSQRAVRLIDRHVIPVVRWFESRVRVPVGLSVFLVARKPM